MILETIITDYIEYRTAPFCDRLHTSVTTFSWKWRLDTVAVTFRCKRTGCFSRVHMCLIIDPTLYNHIMESIEIVMKYFRLREYLTKYNYKCILSFT
jgi:hypothetical protein